MSDAPDASELPLFALPEAPSARATPARRRSPRKPKPVSAGILLWRPNAGDGSDPASVRAGGRSVEVLLAHPGGPFYVEKDTGVWTVPKGLVEAGEEAQSAARREFHEEIGLARAADAPLLADLGEATLKSGKLIHVWASPAPAGLPPAGVPLPLPAPSRRSTFAREWPPRSGQWQRFPEIDLAMFLDLVAAAGKIHPVQRVFLDRLEALLMSGASER